MATDPQRPLHPDDAPDPSNNYERSHPENESGMGRLDNNMDATPTESPDRAEQAVGNRQTPRQINAHDVVNDRAHNAPGEEAPVANRPEASQPEPDHSMLEEEPDGWDQAPTDIHDPRQQRHPRREGKGGTP